jgi:propionyl-CoA carboxylase alpha chain
VNHTPRITTLLVANRGEIACRIIRTARAMGIRTVAVYVHDDAHAPHVTVADDAVRLEPESYLDVGAILQACGVSGADAVHPGYGFLSENADFARAVQDAGIRWVGPGPEAIAAMGDKLAAKRAAIAAGVPTLPMAESVDDAAAVGYPLLVKAAAGGGGKGMRVVNDPAELDEAVAAARREAGGAFGDDRVFLERYVPRSRHVEIQILADSHGAVVHLGERECSIQRRHQKVIEEAPSPVVDDAMRDAMGSAAVALARQLGYVSAGTVEFLVDDAPGPDGRRAFWFLEVNTRLQVEHPVTECVTSVDLVREQLRVAEGDPLDFAQRDVVFRGHAIEVRLYAEDPDAGYLPSTGTLHAFEPAAEPALRWDAGVVSGSVVGTRFDPMLAKVISHAPSRTEAALALALGLDRLHLAGVTTNRHLLRSVLRSTAFLDGDTTTDFLERVPLDHHPETSRVQRVAAAVALWIQGRNREEAPVLGFVPSGWRNARLPQQWVGLRSGDTVIEVRYHAERDGGFVVTGLGRARVFEWSSHGIDAEVAGRRVALRLTTWDDRIVVNDGSGDISFQVVPRFTVPGAERAAGGLDAPMPGRVLDVRVAVGDRVGPGQILLILEAMKMEHRITAPEAGVVSHVYVAAGDQVVLGAPLLAVEREGDDPQHGRLS